MRAGSAFRIFLFGRRRQRRPRRVYVRVGVPQPVDFYDGRELSLLGRGFVIRVEEGTGRTSRARVENGVVSVRLAESVTGRQRKRHIGALSRRAISNCVLPDVRARVEALNARHFNYELGGVRIKDQKTRWGSYSKRTNNIYLNFRLLFAPDDVLDYVIVHELAHIRELNHSRDFWRLVEGAVPDYKARKKWLRENGGRLGSEPRPVQKLLTA
jgi:hypothetical protein